MNNDQNDLNKLIIWGITGILITNSNTYHNSTQGNLYVEFDNPSRPNIIFLSGPTTNIIFVEELLRISTHQFLKALNWLGEGDKPCAYKDNGIMFDATIPISAKLWPK